MNAINTGLSTAQHLYKIARSFIPAATLKSAKKFITNTSDSFDSLSKKEGVTEATNTIGALNTIFSVWLSVKSIIAGQATGGLMDFVTGFLDIKKETHREDGRAESGTANSTLGKYFQNFASYAITVLPERIVPKKALSRILPSLMILNGASAVDEIARPDGQGMALASSDVLSSFLSIFALNSKRRSLVQA